MRKTVLVTGSSSGIGKEIARILAKDYDVILHYNSNENSTRLLKEELDIPVFHDDQHGTAIVVAAGLLNALKFVGKKMEDANIVINGAGSAGISICKLLLQFGAGNVVLVDQKVHYVQEKTG